MKTYKTILAFMIGAILGMGVSFYFFPVKVKRVEVPYWNLEETATSSEFRDKVEEAGNRFGLTLVDIGEWERQKMQQDWELKMQRHNHWVEGFQKGYAAAFQKGVIDASGIKR